MKKKLFLRIFIGTFLFGIFLNSQPPVYATTKVIHTETTQTTVKASNIIWRYKHIDGKLYKRKYDTTSKEWIGSWIPV